MKNRMKLVETVDQTGHGGACRTYVLVLTEERSDCYAVNNIHCTFTGRSSISEHRL